MTSLTIDCHGHFTSEPPEFLAYRDALIAARSGAPDPGPYKGPPDDELRDIVQNNQLKLQQQRGTDLTVLSPRASAMHHPLLGRDSAVRWSRLSNDTVLRICALFPENFAPVCQLPQTVGDDLSAATEELERCVAAGFVGCNINPDPSGGHWTGPSLADPWWDPLWEAMTRLDVPGMIHVSGSCEPALHTTGAYYLAADTVAFMQLLQGDVFERYPTLRLIIPHGGGAAPYHWGRYRGLAMMLGKEPIETGLMQHVYFDSCVYHQVGIDTLFAVVKSENILFGSELLGAVRADDPLTGHAFDDTRRYIDAVELGESARSAVLETNARRVYPRLDALLSSQGR